MKIKLDKIQTSYPNSLTPPIPEEGAKPASVIVPIYINTRSNHSVVLTKRNQKLKNHPGQISFPGGVMGEGETLLETALREWEEELGVNSQSLELLGSIGEFNTHTGYTIVPFVAVYSGNFQFKPNPDEVEKVILLDLDEFNNSPFFEMVHPRLEGRTVFYLLWEDELIWGATAYILVTFLREFGEFLRNGVLVRPNLSEVPFFNPKLPYELVNG